MPEIVAFFSGAESRYLVANFKQANIRESGRLVNFSSNRWTFFLSDLSARIVYLFSTGQVVIWNSR